MPFVCTSSQAIFECVHSVRVHEYVYMPRGFQMPFVCTSSQAIFECVHSVRVHEYVYMCQCILHLSSLHLIGH